MYRVLIVLFGSWILAVLASQVQAATACAGVSGNLNSAESCYYAFTLPTGADVNGLRVVVATTANADIKLYQSADGTGAVLKQQDDSTLGTALLSPSLTSDVGDLVPGATYSVLVRADFALNYQIFVEAQSTWTINWDGGNGVAALSQPNSVGGDYLLKVVTPAATMHGAARMALDVGSGDARFFSAKSTDPTNTTTNKLPFPLDGAGYRSTDVGDDGLVLGQTIIGANATWLIRINAQPGASWSFVAGEIHVDPLGTIAAAGGGAATVGPEGMAFFSTTAGAGLQAWRVSLNGATRPLLVKGSSAPYRTKLNGDPNTYTESTNRLSESGQLLLVPPYVVNGSTYYIGIPAAPGTVINLNSEPQQITDLGNNLFSGVNVNVGAGEYGFKTFKVNVDTSIGNQIAWQVNLEPLSGNPQMALRAANVPSDGHNDAYSEAGAGVLDSLTMVPPVFSNGSWYITVYGDGAYNANLSAINPVAASQAFINDPVPIHNDQPSQAGWRYYLVPAAAHPQTPADPNWNQGWELELDNHVAGSEIALRRTNLPSRWSKRVFNNNAAPTVTESVVAHVDLSTTTGLLSDSRHATDNWYVGVYHPGQPLGGFDLYTSSVSRQSLGFSASVSVVGQPANTWKFFRIDVPDPSTLVAPNEQLGWDLRLDNVTGGLPALAICRDKLPETDMVNQSTSGESYPWPTTTTHGSLKLYNLDHWPNDETEGFGCWVPDDDWTGRDQSATNIFERYRIAAMGMGSPLEPGVYYVGVSDRDSSPDAMSYTLRSRGIGIGDDQSGNPWPIQVQTLAFSGGSISATDLNGFSLPPREAAYYRVTVPASADTWSMGLTPTEYSPSDKGEAMLAVRAGKLPNVAVSLYSNRTKETDDATYHQGIKWQKNGREHFYKYARDAESIITPGAYYVVVASEGRNPTSGKTGTGLVEYHLDSQGAMPVDEKLSPPVVPGVGGEVQWAGQSLAYGQQKAYRFTVPAGLFSLKVQLPSIDVTGNPDIALYHDNNAPNLMADSHTTVSSSYDANEGGQNQEGDATHAQTWWKGVTGDTITIANPEAGQYTVLVRASKSGSAEVDAMFKLVASAEGPTLLDFNNGVVAVPGLNSPHLSGEWRYFLVNVPDDNQVGWDVRLTNVTSGSPSLVVCRDKAPTAFDNDNTLPSKNQWESQSCWSADYDYASTGARYRSITMGMDAPLEPGAYYIGVSNRTGTAEMQYSIESRGIGQGSSLAGSLPWAIQVQDLAFSGGVSNVVLDPVDMAFFKVNVPPGSDSFAVELNPATPADEAVLAVGFGTLPNVEASDSRSVETDSATSHQGALMKKSSREFFYKYARAGENTISSGSYYLVVQSQGNAGGAASLNLVSLGEQPVNEQLSPELGVLSPISWVGQQLGYGQQKAFRFRVPANLISLEIQLTGVTGNPDMSVYASPVGAGLIPDSYYSVTGSYDANEGGQAVSATYKGNSTITITRPAAGDYTLLVVASKNGTVEENAGFGISVIADDEVPLAFNGGLAAAVFGQQPSAWKFYEVSVPADALGWDLRLENVTAGTPGMMVCRADDEQTAIPVTFTTTNNLPQGVQWTEGRCWSPEDDWITKNTTGENYQILAVGMNAPLTPGRYVVGVSSQNQSTGPLAYQLHSRGVGIGDDSLSSPWAIQVMDLPFGTSALPAELSVTGLPHQEVAYYRVQVPAGVKGWSADLETHDGTESLLIAGQGVLPNIYATSSRANEMDAVDGSGFKVSGAGSSWQKPGNEYFYKYARSGAPSLTPGTYYVGVVAQGGVANYTISSKGEIQPDAQMGIDLGQPGAEIVWRGTESAPGTGDWSHEQLQYGQQKTYSFHVPAGLHAIEVRLDNRTGSPGFSVRRDSSGAGLIPDSFYAVSNPKYDANEGGQAILGSASNLLTIPLPQEGDYTVLVTASNAQVGQYDLRVRGLVPVPLAFDGGSTGPGQTSLLDQQVQYYVVDVPAAVLGWRLRHLQTSGDATLCVRPDHVPNGDGETICSDLNETILTPRYLHSGTWYVQVKGVGLTNFVLTSHSTNQYEGAWVLPEAMTNNPWVAGDYPGLVAPMIGDSGVDQAGDPIPNPNDGDRNTTDIDAETFHLYRVSVPAGNAGIIQTYLNVFSGSPHLYVRHHLAPTLAHDDDENSWAGTSYDRLFTGANSKYASWVPLDNRSQLELTEGSWWIAVFAHGSSARYQLQVSAPGVEDTLGHLIDTQGLMQDLAQNGGSFMAQGLVSGKTRYYRVQVPEASTNNAQSTPVTWTVQLTKTGTGNFKAFVRDTVPPGLSAIDGALTDCSHSGNFSDWSDDGSQLVANGSPSPYVVMDGQGSNNLLMPPVEPGKTYYIGVYACSEDTSFNISSSVSSTKVKLDGDINFYNGTTGTVQIASGARKLYRIRVPALAGLWSHSAVHNSSVNLYLMQGTLPPESSYAHWRSTQQNHGYQHALYDPAGMSNNYPWQPDQDYYLLVANNGATQNFSFTMAGNDDSDSDGLPDWWESRYFSNLAQSGFNDPDGDGLVNSSEYVHGTNPANGDSDGDGMPDKWEVDSNLDPLRDDAFEDADQDGASNIEEWQAGTDPNEPDTDGDGMYDGFELFYGFDPLVPDGSVDADGDGFTNLEEFELGTNPLDINDYPLPPPECPSSNGHGGSVDPVIDNFLYQGPSIHQCLASRSIIAIGTDFGSGAASIQIEGGAEVQYVAPLILIGPNFSVKEGALFRASP